MADSKGLPKLGPIDEAMSRRWGTGTMVVPSPMEVDEIMRQVPRGRIITINKIREALAEKHGATICCPMTTGIFAWISAHAAEEAAAEGVKGVTPYWRTLKANGELNEKYPGGIEQQAINLQMEGHEIVPGKGKKPPRVKDYEKYLAEV